MTAAVRNIAAVATLTKADPTTPVFRAEGRDRIFIKAGTSFDGAFAGSFAADTEVAFGPGIAGTDYLVFATPDGGALAQSWSDGSPAGAVELGGFHFAPGGNATARAGGDDIPAINPPSCWDVNFRPACRDPRGMAMIIVPDRGLCWVDIYKLGVDHRDHGTSRFGVIIADGDDLPQRANGKGVYPRFDYAAAVEIYASHGKQLLTYDEFRIAAFGVTEKTARERDPKTTGLDAPRTSRAGIMQATGNLWDWGTDGDPDNPRASLFGGSWFYGDDAGSRYADLDFWPDFSYESVGARGRSDHLMPA